MIVNTPKIYVAGHKGMVGSAIVRALENAGQSNIVTRDRPDLDLLDQQQVRQFFKDEGPDMVYLAAAKVGGIHANNTFPAEFIYENLMVQSNVIHEAWLAGVKKLLFLGSSCIYPKVAEQPMGESSLLSGSLEPTNEPYAIAKIAGIKLCESYNRQYGSGGEISYRSVMPTNLYGPGDNYHPDNSHVIPGLIRRVHEAKTKNLGEVVIWGSGNPRREFLHVDDMASASLYVMSLDNELYSASTAPMLGHLNVGSGQDITIKDLAYLIAGIVGYQGKLIFDTAKPDGSPRKLMSSHKLNMLGWKSQIELRDGLSLAYSDFLENFYNLRM